MGKVRAVADKEDRPVSEVIRWAVEKFIDINLTKTFFNRRLQKFYCGKILVFPKKIGALGELLFTPTIKQDVHAVFLKKLLKPTRNQFTW